MKITTLFISINLLLLSSLAYADNFAPSHLCFEPRKPLLLATKHHKESFVKDINEYKFCIQRFIKAQEKDIRKHKNAIKEATDDWNRLMKTVDKEAY